LEQNSGNVSEHKLKLAKELLDDIELGRLPIENLLLKVNRLARFLNDDEIRKWTTFEMNGYSGTDATSLRYMTLTGRWTDIASGSGYWQPLAEIEALIGGYKTEMQQLQVPNINFAPSSANPHELVTGWGGTAVTQATAPVGQVINRLSALTTWIATFASIRSKVLSLLHGYVSRVSHELQFSNLQESIFERQKDMIDARLAESCGTVLEKVPAIYDRLGAFDAEAISQALSTCRRIIDAFADSVFPPKDETLELDGNTINLTAKHHQNRINAFIVARCSSDSRRKQLRRALADLYDRVSVGVHQDVTGEEARFLFLRTYLLLGEILSLDTK
jgi:hypothetical protein